MGSFVMMLQELPGSDNVEKNEILPFSLTGDF